MLLDAEQKLIRDTARSFANKKARDNAIEAYHGSPERAKIVGTLRPTIRRREVRIMKSLPYSTIR